MYEKMNESKSLLGAGSSSFCHDSDFKSKSSINDEAYRESKDISTYIVTSKIQTFDREVLSRHMVEVMMSITMASIEKDLNESIVSFRNGLIGLCVTYHISDINYHISYHLSRSIHHISYIYSLAFRFI